MLMARSVHPLPGEAERRVRLLALIDRFSSRRVFIVGDLIASIDALKARTPEGQASRPRSCPLPGSRIETVGNSTFARAGNKFAGNFRRW